MKWLDKLRCAMGMHDLTQWRRTNYPKLGAYANRVTVFPSGPPGTPQRPQPMNQRHCKRAGCTYHDVKPLRARKLRPANEADTLQGITK